jgi:hypothetical protein
MLRLPHETDLFSKKTISVKQIFPFPLILIFSFLNANAQESKDSGAIEPKNRFEIIIDGKTYQVVEGQILTLDSTISKPSISVKLSARKKIETASLSFEYPKHLSFEYEKNPGLKTWTLSGNSLVVTLFELDAKIPLNAVTEPMVKKFGKKNCTVEDFNKELGHRLINGKRLHVKLAGTAITIDFYEIISGDAKSRFISFQGTLKDNGESTDEFNEGFQMINTSIKFL